MSNVLAAIGLGQLKTMEERVARRRAIFDQYSQSLAQVPGIRFTDDPPWSRSNHWLTCIRIDSAISGVTPDEIRLALERENIESRPLWKPMHLQPVFGGVSVVLLPVSRKNYSTKGYVCRQGTD